MRWTQKDVDDYNFKKSGRAVGEQKTLHPAKNPTSSKEKDWITENVGYWCKSKGLILETEVRFDSDRRFRFDLAIKSLKIAIEYNGIMSKKSRHTSVTGYTRDMTKLNLAQINGWRVLQYTPINYREVLNDLGKMIG